MICFRRNEQNLRAAHRFLEKFADFAHTDRGICGRSCTMGLWVLSVRVFLGGCSNRLLDFIVQAGGPDKSGTPTYPAAFHRTSDEV